MPFTISYTECPQFLAHVSGVCLSSQINGDQASTDFKGTLHLG